MTVLRDFGELGGPSVPAVRRLLPLGAETLGRAVVATVVPPLAWLVSVWMCVEALALGDAALALRVALLLGAAVPAVGSMLLAREMLRLPVLSVWLLLGVLPSLAGGLLLGYLA